MASQRQRHSKKSPYSTQMRERAARSEQTTYVRQPDLHHLARSIRWATIAGAAYRRAAGAVAAACGAGMDASRRACGRLGLGRANRALGRLVLRSKQYSECVAGWLAARRMAVDPGRHAYAWHPDDRARGTSRRGGPGRVAGSSEFASK